MPVTVIDKIKQKSGNFKLMDAADVEMPDGKSVAEAFDGIEATIPVFDLAELGLTAIPVTGGSGLLQTDTTAIQTALAKGPVGFVIPVNAEAVINAFVIMNGAEIGGDYQCISVVNIIEPATVTVNVNASGIQVIFASLKDSVGLKEAAEVDFKGYESNGVVVENYADGSSLTHTFEFDANGRPTKRTDSNGGETIFTWG